MPPSQLNSSGTFVTNSSQQASGTASTGIPLVDLGLAAGPLGQNLKIDHQSQMEAANKEATQSVDFIQATKSQLHLTGQKETGTTSTGIPLVHLGLAANWELLRKKLHNQVILSRLPKHS